MAKPRKLSRRKKQKPLKEYRRERDLLNAHGWSLRLSRKPSAGQKSAVTKLWKAKRFYLVNQRANRVEFSRLSRSQLRTAGKVLSSDQLTPKGFFFQRPKGIGRRAVKYSVEGSGIRVTVRGRINDLLIPLNARLLLKNPQRAAAETLKGHKKPRQVLLMVNGFQARDGPLSLREFMDQAGGDSARGAIEVMHTRKKMTYQAINDIFKFRLIY